MKIIVSDRAKSDLVSIVEYISIDNKTAANELKSSFVQSFTTLSDNPKMGRPGRVEGTREIIPHRNYIAAYSVSQTTIHILTVRHAARMWPESFD